MGAGSLRCKAATVSNPKERRVASATLLQTSSGAMKSDVVKVHLRSGMKVRVRETFEGDSPDEHKRTVNAGCFGVVDQLDAHGDALIKFTGGQNGFNFEQWIWRHNFNKLDTTGEEDASTEPSLASLASPAKTAVSEEDARTEPDSDTQVAWRIVIQAPQPELDASSSAPSFASLEAQEVATKPENETVELDGSASATPMVQDAVTPVDGGETSQSSLASPGVTTPKTQETDLAHATNVAEVATAVKLVEDSQPLLASHDIKTTKAQETDLAQEAMPVEIPNVVQSG